MSAEPPPSVVTALSFVGRTGGAVKTLPGFQKGRHTLPTAVTPATTAFLAKLCEAELTALAEAFFQRSREAFAYKRRELALSVASPAATLTAKDFTFELLYSLEEPDPARYTVTHTLHGLRAASFAARPEVEAVFVNTFTDLVFTLRRGVQIEAVIDAVESLDSGHELSVHYPSDCRDCTLAVPGTDATVRCTGATLELVFPAAGSPAALLEGFAAVRSAFSLSPTLAALFG